MENLFEDDLTGFGWLGDDVGTDVWLGEGINVGIDDGLVLPSTFELLGSADLKEGVTVGNEVGCTVGSNVG